MQMKLRHKLPQTLIFIILELEKKLILFLYVDTDRITHSDH